MASHFRKMTGKFIHFFQPERNESKKGWRDSAGRYNTMTLNSEG